MTEKIAVLAVKGVSKAKAAPSYVALNRTFINYLLNVKILQSLVLHTIRNSTMHNSFAIADIILFVLRLLKHELLLTQIRAKSSIINFGLVVNYCESPLPDCSFNFLHQD